MRRIIGITGGVGSGKSRILSILETTYQARIIQADLVAAELEGPGQPGLMLLVERFGTEILDQNGCLDRNAFAKRIFSDPDAVQQVNAIIHPLTYKEIQRRIDASTASLIVVEAALFDREHIGMCDEIWFVDTKEETRIERLMTNRGYSREKCRSIIANQASRADFLSLSTHVIDNNGTLDETKRQIAALLQ